MDEAVGAAEMRFVCARRAAQLSSEAEAAPNIDSSEDASVEKAEWMNNETQAQPDRQFE